MGILLYLMVILYIPLPVGQYPGELFTTEEFLAAVLLWPGSNKELNLRYHFLQFPAPQLSKALNFVNSNELTFISAPTARTSWCH